MKEMTTCVVCGKKYIKSKRKDSSNCCSKNCYMKYKRRSEEGLPISNEEFDKGKAERRKGRGGELELCKILNEQGITARPGTALNFGKEPDIIGITNIHAEVKRTEKTHLNAWMTQATEDAEKFGDGAPAVFHRMSRQPWLVTMKLTDWLQLYKKGIDNHE